MRITMNAMMRNYSSSLSSSLNTLNVSRERVTSGRQFSRAYQDPSGAMRAAELHRRYLKTEDHISTIEDAQSRQDSADGALQQIVSMTGTAVNDDALKAINGASSPDSRKTYAISLRETQKALLQFSNATYENSYLFAGADGGNLPFSLDAQGNVTYRNTDVSAGDLDKLTDMANEKLYLDIGLGLQVETQSGVASNSSQINGASAYDSAISGLKALGYGTVEGTDPPISKNVIALLGQMADELEKPVLDVERFGQMRTQLTKSHSQMADYNSEIGVRAKFLENAKSRLEDDKINIYTQIDSVENVQPAEAITDYSYSQYIYNMVLKVGNSLLSNSFIDYMK